MLVSAPREMRKRVAFVTIGESPRDDIVDEMATLAPHWPADRDVLQRGVLDGLGPAAIEALTPESGQPRLVSRLADGARVDLEPRAVHERLRELIAGLDDEAVDLVVLLCTGRFDAVSSTHLLITPQPLVDAVVAALSAGGGTPGILVPAVEQTEGRGALVTHASPYDGDRFESAARELQGADFLVLHCMGYTREHARRMAERTGRPVLLAREIVATSVSWLLG